MVRKTFSLLGKALLMYSIAGFVVLPAAVHFAADKLAPKYLTAPLQIGGVTFNPLTLQLDLQAVTLGENSTTPVVGFHNLTVDLSWSSISQQALVVDNINLVKPVARTILRADSTINFAELLKPSTTSNTAPKPKPKKESAPLSVIVHHIGIQGGDITFTDFAYTVEGEPFLLALNPINLEAKQLKWPNSHGDITLDMGLNKTGVLKINSHIDGGLDTQTQLNLNTISLADLQPYLTPYLYSVVESGSLSGTAHLTWSPGSQLSTNSDISVKHLKVTDSRDRTLVASWNNLTVNALAFSQKTNKLTIEELSLHKPVTRIVLNPNLSINLAGLVKEQKKPETKETANTDASDTSPIEIAIKKFAMVDGALDFSDKSFKPGFAAPITGLNGEIEDFNSRSNQATAIALLGTVDKFSPVHITAKLTPAQPLEDTDISLSFKDIELTTLTPYSGRFAGYDIRKGRMDVALDYGIQNSQLNAKNHVLLHDLTLGDKVPGENTTSLPLKLAIALLKDRDGRIIVDLPIGGDLDNPQFQFGSVIRMAVVNFITNIVTAPFDMLASLVSGDADDMSVFALEPGSNQLTAKQQTTIHSLAQALSERPQLDIEIEPTASTVTDGPILVQQQLQAALESRYQQFLKKKDNKKKDNKKKDNKKKNQPMSEEVHLQLLTELAKEKGISVSKPIISTLTEALIASWPTPELALRKLAISRAHAIKTALIQQGVEAKRIYILGVELKKNAEKDNVLLHLQGR